MTRVTRRETGGWLLSLLMHMALLVVLLVVGRSTPEEATLIHLGGGGPITVELVAGPGVRGPQEPPAPPRVIRKYEPPRVLAPPDKDEMPEPRAETRKSPIKRETRPMRAPNVPRRRGAPSRGTAGEGTESGGNTVRMGIGGSGSGPGLGIGDMEFPFPNWIRIVKAKIQANWRPLVAPVGQPVTYQARVFFRIDRHGRLLELKIVESSGFALYDRSIERAIRLSTPFPPLPMQYGGRTLAFDLTFRYTPGQ